MRIENSVFVVTGAGSGIGRALAETFAAAGARVVAGDIDGAGAASTSARIRDNGGHAVDVCAEAGIATMLTLAQHTFGDVDGYIANAGVLGPPDLGTELDWDRVLDVNLRAHIRAARILVPQWLSRGGGYFVRIASAAGLLSQLGAAPYAVSKHAAVGFTEWLAITHGNNGIGVSCICPMGVDTPLLGAVRDSADSTARLAERSITTSGEVLEARQVADLTIEAVRAGRFLVLPHTEVIDMYRQKGADYDRWIAGMRRYADSLADGA